MPRQELFDAIHALANQVAIVDTAGEALRLRVAGTLQNLDSGIAKLEQEERQKFEPVRTDLLELQKIVDDYRSASTRLVISLRHARHLVQQG